MALMTKTPPIPERENPQPVIIYDDDCTFCRHWIAWFDARLESSAQPKPSTDATLAIYDVSRADADASVQWVSGNDRTSGARAVAAWFKSSGNGRWRLLGRLIASRPIVPLSEAIYRFVARNRHRLPFHRALNP
jgi:predicted DCC family thiol-disulfide oxidoreductase YuxK